MFESETAGPSARAVGCDELRVPPYNLHAEQSLLGGLMLDNGAWDRIADMVSEGDFYRREHRLIFEAITRLATVDQPFDVVTLADALERSKRLDEIGGLSYLGVLAAQTPSAANIQAYARIVRQASVRRQMIAAGTAIAESAYHPDGRDISDLLDEAERRVFAIAEQESRGGGFQPIRSLLAQAVERIDTLYLRDEPITGLATGFTDFDAMTSGLQPADLIIVAGRPSMGKCVAAGTEILLDDGRVAAIEDIVRARQARLLTLGDDWRLRLTQPCAFVDDGRKPVFRITTGLGRQIETTASHPYLTPTGWRPLSELQVGDSIAVPRRLPIFGQEAMRDCEVKLLGYLIGDGNLTGTRPLFTSSDPQVQADFSAAVEAVIAGLCESGKRTSKQAPDALLAAWLGELGVYDHAPHVITVPEIVFRLPREQLALFLNRLFTAAGSATVPAKEPIRLAFGYATPIERLSRQVQHLLLRFGIIAKRYRRRLDPSPSTASVWQVDITETDSIKVFADEIGLVTREPVPTRAMAVEQDHDSTASDVYWDQIVAIESLGERQVYDLTIPETHNFVANDICVHNTAFAMNVAENVAIQSRRPVAVFSMEMPGAALAMRLMSSLGRIDQHRVRTGKLEDDEWPRLTSAVNLLSETLIFIDDTPALSPIEVRARARRLKREQGDLALIVIDYLQLMQAPGVGENRATEISAISRALKGLAKELNVPVIALSQLNRSLEQRPNKRPVMSDLRESGAIEQDADLIVFIYRDEVYNKDSSDKGIAEIIIGKQRNGPIGTVRLTFLGKYTKFENYIGDYYGEAEH
ncbi:MAG: replicative DNA helicase [Thermochromatium sp.]